MPVILDNPRYERLAQNLAAGMKKVDAAVDAGFALTTAENGSDILERNPIILERIAELLEERARTQVTHTDIADQNERKRVLTEILRSRTETPITAGQRIAANKELNLMERVYQDANNATPAVIQINVVLQGGQSTQSAQCLPETPKIIEIEAKPT